MLDLALTSSSHLGSSRFSSNIILRAAALITIPCCSSSSLPGAPMLQPCNNDSSGCDNHPQCADGIQRLGQPHSSPKNVESPIFRRSPSYRYGHRIAHAKLVHHKTEALRPRLHLHAAPPTDFLQSNDNQMSFPCYCASRVQM